MLGKRVGERKAWDIAGEAHRKLGRQAFPSGPHFSTVEGYELDFNDLSKPGLLKLINTYWDQWIKVGMFWVDQANLLCGEQEAIAISDEHYEAVCRYQMPKLAEICGISLDHVVGYVKVNQLGIDATQGYRSVKEIIDDDTVNVKLYDCDVWGKLRDQGVFNDETALAMCDREAALCTRLHGADKNVCVIPIHPQVGFKGVAPGEPICIFNLRRREFSA